jgi:acyl carrier protein
MAADLFGVAEDSLMPDSSPETVEGWDSLQHLNLALAVEERFGFQLSPEEMDRMRTIGRVAEIVERRISGVSS